MSKIETVQDVENMLRNGQVSAFTDFYNQYFSKLLLESDKYVKNVFVAEEIVQTVFLKIWENTESLENIKSIKSYLYKAVINSSINYVNRQKSIEQHHLKISEGLSEENVEALDEENELIVLLHAEIEKLPPQCGKVFKMSRFEHLKYKEIASLLNISERTVENHVATALKSLRIAMLSNNAGNFKSRNHKIIFSLFLY